MVRMYLSRQNLSEWFIGILAVFLLHTTYRDLPILDQSYLALLPLEIVEKYHMRVVILCHAL